MIVKVIRKHTIHYILTFFLALISSSFPDPYHDQKEGETCVHDQSFEEEGIIGEKEKRLEIIMFALIYIDHEINLVILQFIKNLVTLFLHFQDSLFLTLNVCLGRY